MLYTDIKFNQKSSLGPDFEQKILLDSRHLLTIYKFYLLGAYSSGISVISLSICIVYKLSSNLVKKRKAQLSSIRRIYVGW